MGPINQYFKVGDTVRLPDVWGKTLFVIDSFNGNSYLPLASVHFLKKPIANGNRCNFDIRDMMLINAPKRPLKNIDKKVLAKLYVKSNIEAKREFLIRKNNR